MKKELEEKTGKTSSESKKKKTNQEELLKKIKSKKKQREDIGIDIYELNRSTKYTADIDVQQVVDLVKEKMWTENKNVKLINVALTAYGLVGEYQKAEMEYKKGIHIDPENSDLNYNMAEIYLKQGDIPKALEKIANCIKGEKEKDYDALYLMALMLFLQGAKEKAASIVAGALKNDMEFERVHQNFAFLSLLRGNEEKTEEILSVLLQKAPDQIFARIVMTYIKARKGEFAEYKKESALLMHLIKDNTNQVMQHIRLSRVYYFLKKGEADKAESELNNFTEEQREKPEYILLKANFDMMNKKDFSEYEYIKDITIKNINFLPLFLYVFKIAYLLKKGEDFNKFLSILLKINKNQTIGIKIGDEKEEIKVSELIKKLSEYNKKGIVVEMDMDIEPFSDFCIYILYSYYNI